MHYCIQTATTLRQILGPYKRIKNIGGNKEWNVVSPRSIIPELGKREIYMETYLKPETSDSSVKIKGDHTEKEQPL